MYLFQQSKTAQEFPAQLGISELLGRTRCAGLRPEDAAYGGGTGDARGKHLFRNIAAEKGCEIDDFTAFLQFIASRTLQSRCDFGHRN